MNDLATLTPPISARDHGVEILSRHASWNLEAQLEHPLGSPAPRNQEETRRDDRIARQQDPIAAGRPPARRPFVQRAVRQGIIEPAVGLKLERRSDFHLPAVVNARERSRLRRRRTGARRSDDEE